MKWEIRWSNNWAWSKIRR